jgi:hypothetical protein
MSTDIFLWIAFSNQTYNYRISVEGRAGMGEKIQYD